MQNRFTEQALEAMQTAQKIMFSKNHSQLDVEHVLLALLQQEDSMPASIITELGGDVEAIKQGLEIALDNRPKATARRSNATGYITLRCSRVMQGAADEADRLNDEYIRTTHLLLAITLLAETHREDSMTDTATAILQEADVTHEKIIATLEEMVILHPQPVKEPGRFRIRPKKVILTPAGLSKPVGFSHGILTTGGQMLFLGGQTALDAEGRVVAPGDVVAQYRQVLGNLKAVVEEAGGAMQDIVKMTIFVQDRDDYKAHLKELGAVHKEFFGAYYPAITLLEVSRFFDDGVLVEIEGIAMIGTEW
jgi:enamine deaminase RidA (YjgF/YER057c/UK114 family)